jgi:tetratricopeptide (TPR) repeat protein
VINDEYRKYLGDHQNDVNALVLYGKFLRQVGERERANLAFTAAYQIDPKLAVVSQQLGNYLAEEGRYASALDDLKRAAALAPTEPLYHYQIGELLSVYYDYFIKDKIYEQAAINEAMAAEFARAAELNPQEPGFAWRYAECFYDMENPDWKAALAAWDALAKVVTAPAELEVIRLHRARVLLELGRRDEARPLLDQPVRPALEAAHAQLVKMLENPPTAKPATAPSSSTAPAPAVSAPPAASS